MIDFPKDAVGRFPVNEICQTELQYVDIVPPPGHSNTTNADFLLSTSTTYCYKPIETMAMFGIEAVFVLAGFLFIMWVAKRAKNSGD